MATERATNNLLKLAGVRLLLGLYSERLQEITLD
jgi:hypothetical protein